MVIVFISFVIVLALWVYLTVQEEHYEKEREKLVKIERIKSYVLTGFEEIEEDADRYGNDYSESLLNFADKMDKMSSLEVRKDLRPYDIYNVKLLSEKTSSRTLGKIVIDKDLVPRFMATALNDNDRDIQLSVALTSSEVRELANKCKKARMYKEIETYRKDKVNKVING